MRGSSNVLYGPRQGLAPRESLNARLEVSHISDGIEFIRNRLSGKLHCFNGPAVVISKGRQLKLEKEAISFEDRSTVITRQRLFIGPAEIYIRDGLVHRMDGPAVIIGEEGQFDFGSGLLYQDNGPAELWFKNGKLHRNGAPAINSRDKVYFENGLIHREAHLGPAAICERGNVWCENGLKHNPHGYAETVKNGKDTYWLDGRHYSEALWQEKRQQYLK
jgi:hypothetical protein